jgi:hypothetical protein
MSHRQIWLRQDISDIEWESCFIDKADCDRDASAVGRADWGAGLGPMKWAAAGSIGAWPVPMARGGRLQAPVEATGPYGGAAAPSASFIAVPAGPSPND